MDEGWHADEELEGQERVKATAVMMEQDREPREERRS